MANPGWDRLWRIGPPVMSVRDRLRLGLPTILILVGSALLGRFIDGLLIGLGTYTVLFGAIPSRPHRAHSFRERLTWPYPEAVMFARVVVAATLAFAIPVMAGGTHPFWAVLVAVLVLSYPGGRRIQVMRTIHRILGTALGFLAYWGWTLIYPPDVVTFAAMGILLWIAMGLAARNYGLACIAITLLALMMTQVLTPDIHPATLAGDRLLTSIIGAAVAVVVMIVIQPRRRRAAEDA